MSRVIRPEIHVSCAIIEQSGRVLAVQRSATMNLPLKWEFPGGKIDPGEMPDECLHRELQEELGIGVEITRVLVPHTHHYPDFTVILYPFVCAIVSGVIVLHEHADMVWLLPDELISLDWAEADYPVIQAYRKQAASRSDGPE